MKQKFFLRKSLILLTILIFSFLTACGNSNQSSGEDSKGSSEKEVIKLRVGTGHTVEAGLWVKYIKDYFIPEIDKKLENTKYEIDWSEAYGGTVVVMGEELKQIGDNTVDIGFVTSAFYPSRIAISNIGYNVPFSSPDPRVISKAAQKIYNKYPEYGQEFEENNQKVLGIVPSEGYDLFTTFPVNSIEDLQGKKIAAVGANLHWIDSVGTVPVQSNVGEAYQSLQSGVYEGWVMLPNAVKGYRLHEQAKHLTKVGFGSVILGALTINSDTWNRLPQEVQSVLEEIGLRYTTEIANALYESSQSSIAEMEKEGLKVSELPKEDVVKWMEKMPNIPNKFVKTLNEKGFPGKKIMEDYMKFQEEEGYEFSKNYEIK
jgi:TRAP-type C4-dicarboxylate transport system substrate-binding protein